MLCSLVSANVLAERSKYALEKFDISELSLTGTWYISNVRYATIIDNEGYLYIAHEGDYMGKNYGRIRTVGDDKIEVCDVILNKKNGEIEGYTEECYWLIKKGAVVD